MLWFIRKIPKPILDFRITLIFTFFYSVINVLLWWHNNFIYPTGKQLTFLTSWFNPTEDWYKQPFKIGIIYGFFIPLITIAWAEFYSRNIQKSKIKKYVSIDSIFFMSVFSTYILSGTRAYYLGHAGSGSSLVSFAVAGSFFIIFFIGAVTRSKSTDKNAKAMTTELTSFVLYFLSLIIYLGRMVHYVGIGIYLLFVITLVGARVYDFRKKETDSVSAMDWNSNE